jgi:hypothetical protein
MLAGATAGAAEPCLVHRNCTRPDCWCGIPAREYQYRSRSPSQTAVSLTGVLLRTRTVVTEVLEPTPAPVRAEYRDEEILRYHPGNNQTLAERRINHTLQMPEKIPQDQEQRLEQFVERLPAPPPEGNPNVPPMTPPDVQRPGERRRVFSEILTAQSPPPERRRQTIIELYQLDRPQLKIDQCEISQVALQLHDDGQWVLSLRADQNRRPETPAGAPYNPRLYIKRNQFTVRLRCLGAFKNEPVAGALAAGKPVLVDLDPEPFWVENGKPRYVRTVERSALVANHFADIDRVEIEFFYR